MALNADAASGASSAAAVDVGLESILSEIGTRVRNADQRMRVASLRTAVEADHTALAEGACAADASAAISAGLEAILPMVGALIGDAYE